MRPTPVLHVIDTGGPGGAETVYLDLLCGLHRDRWEPIAVVPERDWLWEALENRGIEPVLLRGTRSFDFAYLSRLRSLARSRRVALLQTHLLGSAVYGAAVGRLLRIPQVSTFHGTVDISASDRHLRAKLWILDRASTRLVFVSQSLQRHFETISGHGPAAARVIHNGIDLETFRPGSEPELRADFGVGQEEILLGAIGNVRPAKDYPTLLRALAELAKRGIHPRCIIVGQPSGSLGGDLLALRAALGLEKTVEFIGFRSDIDRVLQALDALVISSSSEGFSLTAVQALATGTPVVSTRCGGPEEILEHDVTGVLVPAGSPSALADGIERICSDRALRARLSSGGRRVAESRFSLHMMIEGYERLYHELSEGRRGARA
ncbi:MAG: glycosyltransferase [Gemmatimonadota bacterium]